MLLGAFSAAFGGSPRARHQQRLDRAVAKAAEFLSAQLGEDGTCSSEYQPESGRHLHGGKTAMIAYALLTAGADPKDPPLAAALSYLEQAELTGIYAVALRANAFAALKGARYRKGLAADVKWLIEAADPNGAYTYWSAGGKTLNTFDNSNNQMAVLGVWAGARVGIPVPMRYWQTVERYWDSQQNKANGGWGYRPGSRVYGSMTAAGLATMYICFDNLHRVDFIRCRATGEYKPIEDGMKWLAANFSVRRNPRHTEYKYYWLYSLERVGLASGRKYIGQHDWYAEGSAHLLATQGANGSWGRGDRVADTAFALLFLVRGRNPVLVNKLRYTGRWNARPRDMANLTSYLSHTFERTVRWQIV
ncbi:MAG: hypothetical protein KAU28_03370, partial [Phycisphaerae bacterium]|nr:hypothetical protein [Phycisphaerae bacterium]